MTANRTSIPPRMAGKIVLVTGGTAGIGRAAVRGFRARGDAVLVADLDLDQRRDWLDAFPFFRALRPDAYAPGLATMSTMTSTRITSSIRV